VDSGAGDRRYSVTIYNRTGATVVVEERDIGLLDNKPLVTRLEAGANKTSHWLAPSGEGTDERQP
jgi:hypothetical protein